MRRGKAIFSATFVCICVAVGLLIVYRAQKEDVVLESVKTSGIDFSSRRIIENTKDMIGYEDVVVSDFGKYQVVETVSAIRGIDNDDRSRLCSSDKPFLAYVYGSSSTSSLLESPSVIKLLNSEVALSLVKELGDSWTNDPGGACVFVVVVGPWPVEAVSHEDVNDLMNSLPHWKTYSNRHVVIELSSYKSNYRPFSQVNLKAAHLATSYSLTNSPNFILIPPVPTDTDYHYVIPPTESLLHKTRTMQLYFEGEKSNSGSQLMGVCNLFPKSVCLLTCNGDKETGALDSEWSLCSNAAHRLQKCQKALFALIPCGDDSNIGLASLTRLLEALQCGAVPVIIGTCKQLPFSDLIDYGEAVIFASKDSSNFSKLLVGAQNNFRKYQEHGLFLFNTYFSSALKIVGSVIAVLRSQYNHPPMWYHEYKPEVLLNMSPRRSDNTHDSFSFHNSRSIWNSPPGPLFAPASPLSGTFNQSNEKFTILIITHHREKKLLRLIATLKNCPNLDKLVVVWNNEKTYKNPKDYKWPNIGVPIEVIILQILVH